jgi:hypothetical protein
MTRRSMCRVLCVSAVMAGMTGCETLRSRLRPDDDDKKKRAFDSDDSTKPKSVESDTSKILSPDSDSSNPKPFFKSDRRSGAWSSEAREIEKDLGVN